MCSAKRSFYYYNIQTLVLSSLFNVKKYTAVRGVGKTQERDHLRSVHAVCRVVLFLEHFSMRAALSRVPGTFMEHATDVGGIPPLRSTFPFNNFLARGKKAKHGQLFPSLARAVKCADFCPPILTRHKKSDDEGNPFWR